MHAGLETKAPPPGQGPNTLLAEQLCAAISTISSRSRERISKVEISFALYVLSTVVLLAE